MSEHEGNFSLHSPFDKERYSLLRKDLPSVNDSIQDLLEFGIQMSDMPCVNYLLFDGINDTSRHAEALCDLLPRERCYLKISSFNPILASQLRPSPRHVVESFTAVIRERGLLVKTFRSRGVDVRAGCGQFVAESAR